MVILCVSLGYYHRIQFIIYLLETVASQLTMKYLHLLLKHFQESEQTHPPSFFFFFFFFFFFLLFRAKPVAYGGSQARGRTEATAASL